ncbi:hypothetical protein BDQ17DRAFT_1335518 [Cyathus striatus]|nr:hypothetical protein BDQ17DRAFT_1335518 [Cyathus striatus]
MTLHRAVADLGTGSPEEVELYREAWSDCKKSRDFLVIYPVKLRGLYTVQEGYINNYCCNKPTRRFYRYTSNTMPGPYKSQKIFLARAREAKARKKLGLNKDTEDSGGEWEEHDDSNEDNDADSDLEELEGAKLVEGLRM